MQDDISIMRVLQAIFLRRGRETARTKLFQNFTEQVQSQFRQSILFTENEQPVLGYLVDNEDWLLITTRNICLYQSGKVVRLPNAELSDVGVQFPKPGERRKPELTKLLVTLRSGERHVLDLEGGTAYVGIWNILLHVKTLNQAGDK